MIGSGALKWVKLNLLGVVQSQSQVWGGGSGGPAIYPFQAAFAVI